jgi:hypothetical protein
MPTRVTYGGDSWLVEDLTLDEVCEVEKETGETWLRLNPLRSAAHARAIMVRFVGRSVGVDEARRELGALPVADVVAALKVVPEDDRPQEFHDGMPVVDPPQAGDAQATT